MDLKIVFAILCIFIGAVDGCCSVGWTTGRTSCYIFKDEKKSWSEAEIDCKNEGGHLAQPNTEDKNNILKDIFIKEINQIDDVMLIWLGGSDLRREGQWQWGDGETAGRPIDYKDWATTNNEPNGRRKENCLSYRGFGGNQWNDAGCDSEFRYICEKKLCPDGWIRYQDSCYILKDQKQNWFQAEKDCYDYGGHLAQPPTKKVNDFLKTIVKEKITGGVAGQDYILIGGTDIGTNGNWRWLNGEHITYSDWKIQNDRNGEDCLSYQGYSDNDWNDVQCDQPYKYICEKRYIVKTDEAVLHHYRAFREEWLNNTHIITEIVNSTRSMDKMYTNKFKKKCYDFTRHTSDTMLSIANILEPIVIKLCQQLGIKLSP